MNPSLQSPDSRVFCPEGHGQMTDYARLGDGPEQVSVIFRCLKCKAEIEVKIRLEVTVA